MNNPQFWGTYYRSTKPGGNYDRLNTIEPVVVMPVLRKRTARRASSGYFISPYDRPVYRHPYYLRSNARRMTEGFSFRVNDYFLYDELLKYKSKMCDLVVKQFDENVAARKRIKVFVRNNFPCVIVQVNSFEKREKRGKKHLYKLCLAYFVAIANFNAKKQKIPIEMVIRASIGYNIPSVSVTDTTFRINIGIVSKMYVTTVLLESLQQFNDKCDAIFSESLNFNDDEIERINGIISKYNRIKGENSSKSKNVDAWSNSEKLVDIMCKGGDSGGNSWARQITRLNQYVELLCDYVHSDIMRTVETLHLSANPLRKILKKISLNPNNQMTMNIALTDYITDPFDFFEADNFNIRNDDEEFTTILQKMASAIKMSNISKTWRLHGLHDRIETANIKFIKDCDQQVKEDGYGSDSDGEGNIQIVNKKITSYFSKKSYTNQPDSTSKCFSRKVIVQSGMRAINFACALAKRLTLDAKCCTKQMYYEAAIGIKYADISIRLIDCPIFTQKLIRCVDLNFCANSPDSESKIDLTDIATDLRKDEQVIVFDYTNATSDRINKALQLVMAHVKVVLLVNSGMKNEQIGADNNPYGTIRIVSTEETLLKSLHEALMNALNLSDDDKELPKRLHDIRKAYKAVGAVLTNESIFQGNWRPTVRIRSTLHDRRDTLL